MRKLAGLAALSLGIYGLFIRPHLLRWGATCEEVKSPFPGAELVPGGTRGATMAVTIEAPPSKVWPWLVQMGYGRAGWYSWDYLDNFGRRSYETLEPKWQDVKVGDYLSGPNVTELERKAWEVAALEPERFLGLRSRVPRSESLWGFWLKALPGERTRLIVSGYWNMQPRWLQPFMSFAVLEWTHWIMQTKQFTEIKRRAERDAGAVSNRVIQVTRFGDPDVLQVVDAPMPTARRGEVRIHVLASGIEYTDVTIRRHLYPQTAAFRPPFVLGYDFVGEIDRLGDEVSGFQLGERVADMTVIGSNSAYRARRAADLVRVPAGVDAAEAAALVLSWTTAYQLLHRLARVRPGQRVLVQGAAGAVGQALLVLGKMAGVKLWGTGRSAHAALIRQLGATPIDYEREDIARMFPQAFDVVFDGVGKDDFNQSFAALKPGGLLCAYGYTAGVKPRRRLFNMLMWSARVYLRRRLLGLLPGGKRLSIYSINAMRARHPRWFKEDLERLFALLASHAIKPRVAERISFNEVADAHRRLEAGGLDGKLVLCPDLGMAHT